jgi:hypothetical protein
VILDATDTVTDDDASIYAYELSSNSAMNVAGISFNSGAHGNFNWGAGDTLALSDSHTIATDTLIDAKSAQLLGSAGVDTFTVTGSNALDFTLGSRNLVKFNDVSTVDALGDIDRVTGSNASDWLLTGTDNQAINDDITFNGVEQLVANSAGVVALDGPAETFIINGAGDVDVHNGVAANKMNITGLNKVMLKNGEDSVSDSADLDYVLSSDTIMSVGGIEFNGLSVQSNYGWGVNDSLALADGHTVSGTVAASGAQLLGSDSSDTFTIVGAGDINYQRANIGDVVNFTGINTVNAGSGSDQVNAAANTNWQLNGNGALSAQSVNFTGVDKASATTSQLLATTGNDSFSLSEVGNVSVAGIVFDGLDNIDGNGGTDSVDGNGAVWSASSAEAAKAIAVMSGISVIFTNIDAVLNTGTFAGVDINSIYDFSDINTMSYTGLTFSGVSQLDAGSATDELKLGDLDSTWSLDDDGGRVSSSDNSLDFSGIENITSGSGVDTFTVSSGTLNNIDTGAGNDFVNLNGGVVASLKTGDGDDVVELNNVASASVSLLGGSGTDNLLVNIDNVEWRFTDSVSETNYVSGTAFSEFEDLTNSSINLDLYTTLVTTFNRDNVSFNDGSMTLYYRSNGDILLDSQATGANSITGTVVANRLDISASGDIDLDTEIVELKVANNDISINVDVSAEKDLVIEQVDAGAAGDIVLTSKVLGALTFKTFGETHLIANTVTLGSESERLGSMGEINNQLRADVFTSVDIVAVSFVTPDFINQQPSVSVTGAKSQSTTNISTSVSLKSLEDKVEGLTQLDQAIFNEVSPYSIGAYALYNPEMRLIDGILLPIEAIEAGDKYEDCGNLENSPLKPACDDQTGVKQLQLRNDYPELYEVQGGDTLWNIAKKYLEDPSLWSDLWKQSPQVQNPDLIYPGDMIKVIVENGKVLLTINRAQGDSFPQ